MMRRWRPCGGRGSPQMAMWNHHYPSQGARSERACITESFAIQNLGHRDATSSCAGMLLAIKCRRQPSEHTTRRRVTMASKQMKHMNEIYASIKERVSKPGLDLATNRDIVENLHLAAAEPEAVTYAEVDADGVPALWFIPQGSDPGRVPVHSPPGRPFRTPIHTDPK